MNLIYIFISILFFILASYLAVFLLWRKVEQDHVEEPGRFLDKLFQSVLLAYGIGKIASILLSVRIPFSSDWRLNTNLLVFSHPVALIAFFLSFLMLAKETWRDRVHLLDMTSIAISSWLGLLSLGTLLSLAVSFVRGVEPQVTFLMLTASFVSTLFYFFLAILLNQLELRYRTFLWYRYRRSSAQSGFVIASFLIAHGAMQIVQSIVSGRILGSLSETIEFSLYPLLMVSGFVILYVRSGRWKSR